MRHKVRCAVEFGPARAFLAWRREPKLSFTHYLSVRAIAKNEGRYFREWIEFHKLVGVEKFYIYDNSSSDDTREVLAPYIKSGLVEYTFWPGAKRQYGAYEDCVRRHKFDTRWLALIDLDEFMVPVATKTIPEFLRSLAPGVSQLLIGWMLYGSSGHEKKPEGLVMENYKRRGRDESLLYKAIINPRMSCRYTAHYHNCIGETVDENGTAIAGRTISAPLPKDKIRVNHYHCKSWEEYQLKHSRGDAVFGDGTDNYTRATFDARDRNEVFDPIMDRYIRELKKKPA